MTPPLHLRRVSFTYRRASSPALRDIELEIPAGRLTALAGRTGAGKTTCARLCNGLIPFTVAGELQGEVSLFGRPLERRHRHEAHRRVGMLFQDFEAQLFSTSAAGEVAFALENRGLPRAEMRERVDRALRAVGLSEAAQREPGSLSGGQKQRLAIACLLALRPDVLVLDEPTTDLDPVGKREVAKVLGELTAAGHTVLLIEHDTELLAGADRCHCLNAGALAFSGRLTDFAARPRELAALGVRPPDLWTLWDELQLGPPPATVDEAWERLRNSVPAPPPPAPAAGGEPLFALENVSFAYPGGPPALEKINLQLHRGESLALLGPNGAGKTTLVGLLNGLRRPTGGRVLLGGADLAGMSVGQLGRRIGYVFQNPDHQLFAPTVFDEIAFSLKIFGVPKAQWPPRVSAMLDLVRLAGLEDRDPFLMTKGERQKLALAAVLVAEPEVLIMDEPTTGLDAVEQHAMNHLLRDLTARGHTVIIVTHNMDAALAVARRTLLLKDGRLLADGPTREIFARPDLLAAAQLRQPPAAALAARLGWGALPPDALARHLWRGSA